MMRLRFLVLALALTACVTACGDDDTTGGSSAGENDGGGHGDSKSDSGTGSDASNAGGSQSASFEIAAAKGGKVELGNASLNIPGGSLGSDTTVTVATSAPSSNLPDSETVRGLVYDFGPDGTKFSKPATLTLPSAGEPGADEEAVISWLDQKNNAWQDLKTTANSDGSLSAEITHFTNFAVRFNGVVSSDCGFKACGGDVVGTWKITSVCAEIAGPVIDVCPTAVAALDLTLTGSATFNKDGSRSTDTTGKSTITYTLDAKCLDTITKGMPPAKCDALSKAADPTMDQGPTTCTGDPKVSCTCVEDNPEKSEKKAGTYTIDGTSITLTDDADAGATSAGDFCVNGSDLRIKQTDGLAVLTWIATKQ